MSGGVGFVLPILSIGLGSISVRPQRGFFPSATSTGLPSSIVAHATTSETHHDELDITGHPVELGANISDHAVKLPEEVTITCVWSNSPPTNPGILGAAVGVAGLRIPAVGQAVGASQTVAAVGSMLSGEGADQIRAIYQQLLDLQNSRIPFSVLTGKRAYKDMIFKSITENTAKLTENVLMITAVCRRVNIVRTQTVSVPVAMSQQATPEKTASVLNVGQKQLQTVRRAVNPELFER